MAFGFFVIKNRIKSNCKVKGLEWFCHQFVIDVFDGIMQRSLKMAAAFVFELFIPLQEIRIYKFDTTDIQWQLDAMIAILFVPLST